MVSRKTSHSLLKYFSSKLFFLFRNCHNSRKLKKCYEIWLLKVVYCNIFKLILNKMQDFCPLCAGSLFKNACQIKQIQSSSCVLSAHCEFCRPMCRSLRDNLNWLASFLFYSDLDKAWEAISKLSVSTALIDWFSQQKLLIFHPANQKKKLLGVSVWPAS